MVAELLSAYTKRIKASFARRRNDQIIRNNARLVAKTARTEIGQKPVIFFNASTRVEGLSLNAAFSLLTSWGLQLSGIPIIHFVCKSGMSRCVLGTNRDDVHQSLPCEKCIRHSKAEYDQSNSYWFNYQVEGPLRAALAGLGVDEISRFTYQDYPLGEIVMPALRWELRRHHLIDNESTRFLYREFVLSAWNVGREFLQLLEQVDPQAVILFNGQFFPEAMVKHIARQRGIRVISHEVGMLPYTAFFTDGEATAYPIDIPDQFELSEAQNNQLDEYLSSRFKGNFKMAGIQFWQGMKGLDESFLAKASNFRQIVPIFTNVIFDTSQPHSNVVFPDMFTWLDEVLKVIDQHQDTLFVIRAHPDELRPGTAKQSRETVRDWVKANEVTQRNNVVFIDATEYLSSYELIHKSKFVMVYNSSIGLEASILGAPVLAAGRSRYTSYPTVFFPSTPSSYLQQLESFLMAGRIEVPEIFVQNSRKFLYYQLYKTALPFGKFLHEAHRPGLVLMKSIQADDLSPANNATMKVLIDGIREGKPFLQGD